MSKPCLAFWRTNLSVYYTRFQTPEPDEIKKEKREKSQPYSHCAHENTCKCVKFNNKFKPRPTEDETFYGFKKKKKKKVTSQLLHAGISAQAVLHFQFSVKNQIHGLFQVQNERRWQKACMQRFSCDAA